MSPINFATVLSLSYDTVLTTLYIFLFSLISCPQCQCKEFIQRKEYIANKPCQVAATDPAHWIPPYDTHMYE